MQVIICAVDTRNTRHSIDYVCGSSLWHSYRDNSGLYKWHGESQICLHRVNGKDANWVLSCLTSFQVAASAAFLIARYLARERILKLVEGNKKFLAIDKAIGENGFKVVTLLRLSPLLPFSLGNYLYGLTSVKFIPYVLGRLVPPFSLSHTSSILVRRLNFYASEYFCDSCDLIASFLIILIVALLRIVMVAKLIISILPNGYCVYEHIIHILVSIWCLLSNLSVRQDVRTENKSGL